MKLTKENKKITITPRGNIFIIKGSNHTFKSDTPHTVKALSKLYNRGFKDGYIDFKMLVPIMIIALTVIAFIIF